ncbi:hypothetical protein RRF57_011565 [Xylaria bambusicola]|uniref:Uncharacterized protein n=1 Tax=Xylaria bambusicola TaxID=326684 RepID=A0AAN7UYC9_9PEZI
MRPQAWVQAMPMADSILTADSPRSFEDAAAAAGQPKTTPECQPLTRRSAPWIAIPERGPVSNPAMAAMRKSIPGTV